MIRTKLVIERISGCSSTPPRKTITNASRPRFSIIDPQWNDAGFCEQATDGYRTCRSRYEDAKSKAAAGPASAAVRKSEEAARDKFQKAVKRLHVAHNDYVLLLLETADYERDLRTVLLPGPFPPRLDQWHIHWN